MREFFLTFLLLNGFFMTTILVRSIAPLFFLYLCVCFVIALKRGDVYNFLTLSHYT